MRNLGTLQVAKELANERLYLQCAKLIQLPSISFLDTIKKRQLGTYYIYPIKDIGVIEIRYNTREYLYRNVNDPTTLFNYKGMPILNNTLEVSPLCLSSSKYENGILDIFFICRVRVGDSNYVLKEIPLPYIGVDVKKGPVHLCTIKLEINEVVFPSTFLHYLSQDYNMDAILGEELLQHSPTNKKYKRLLEGYQVEERG